MSFLSNFPQPHPITINWRNWNDFSAEGLDLPHNRDINDHVVVKLILCVVDCIALIFINILYCCNNRVRCMNV
jgi:hypothetical protein